MFVVQPATKLLMTSPLWGPKSKLRDKAISARENYFRAEETAPGVYRREERATIKGDGFPKRVEINLRFRPLVLAAKLGRSSTNLDRK